MVEGARILWFAGAMGAWGVASGFAVFFHIHKQAEEGVHLLLIGLGLAGVAAYFIERIREKVYPSAHGHQKVSPGQMLSTIVLLTVLELVIASWEKIAHLIHEFTSARNALLEAVTLDSVAQPSSLNFQLLVFFGFWTITGAAVSIAIARSSLGLDNRNHLPPKRAGRSALVALIAAALLTAVFLIGVRAMLTIVTLLTRPECYAPGFEIGTSYNALENWIVGLASIIEGLAQWEPPLGGYVAVALIAAFGITGFFAKHSFVKAAAWGAFLFTLLNTFFTDGDQFLRLLLAIVGTALVWFVPIAVLSAAGPFLRTVGVEPRYWGFACFGAAVLLVVVTAYRLVWGPDLESGTSLIIGLALVVLVIGGFLFRGDASPREYWPFAALAVGVGAATFTSVLQNVTFLNSFKASVLLTQDALVRERVPGTGKVPALKNDDEASTLLTKAADISGFRWFIGSPEVELKELKDLRAGFAKAIGEREQRLIDSVCAPFGHPVLDAWMAGIVGPQSPPHDRVAPVCARFREALAGDGSCEGKSCRSQALSKLAEDLDGPRPGPVDTLRWRQMDANPPADVWGPWLWDRQLELVPVTTRQPVAADHLDSIRRDVEGRLPASLRGKSTSEQQTLVLNPPADMTNIHWAYLLMLWGISEPHPTEQMAANILRWRCTGRCFISRNELDQFRERRQRDIRLIATWIARVETREADACRARLSLQELDRQDLRSYVALRQADDRLRRLEPQLAPNSGHNHLPFVLELCLVGNIAFWIVAGLLAGWAELERQSSAKSGSGDASS
jgi:hypothetical protein